jgi:AcrR family transcriptional regulator
MTEARTDRRVERTRQLLRDALMALVIEKGYEAISVQDIADRANVARTTFYLHYRDKEELLFDGMAAMYDNLVNQHPQADRAEIEQTGYSTAMATPIDFEHVAQHADFYRIMLSKRGSAAFIVRVRAYLAAIFRDMGLDPLMADIDDDARLPLDLIANYMAGAEIGLVNWWLENDMPYPPEQISRMSYLLTAFGLLWALRIDVPPPDDGAVG